MHRDGGTSLAMLPFSLFGQSLRAKMALLQENLVSWLERQQVAAMESPFMRGIFPKEGRERERQRETAGWHHGIAVYAGHFSERGGERERDGRLAPWHAGHFSHGLKK